ncbi:hypothetical protein HS7_03830 [Sulfolobales archaeon HS-7]|nr:hypothetical protein HS7_03830 [Sulfolobales archaeon HS-7]
MTKKLGMLLTLWNDDYLKKQKELLPLARELGYTEVWSGIARETVGKAKEIAELLNNLGFYYVVDVSPDVFNQLGASPRNLRVFKDIGVGGLRLDWGFSLDEMVEIANNELGLKTELNASVFPVDHIDEFLRKVRDPELVMASHDFYPWMETGLSLEDAVAKSKEFHSRGISVAAFIVRKGGARSTIETLRELDIGTSANVLINTKVIDRIWIGEPEPTKTELEDVSSSLMYTRLRVRVYPNVTEEEKKVFGREFRDVRIKENSVGLTTAGENNITPRNVVRRYSGSVCVVNDNPHYIQVWIFKKDVNADGRFNVIGEILEEDSFLLEHLAERTGGTFRIKDELPPVVLQPIYESFSTSR